MASDDTVPLNLLTLGDSGVGKSWLLLRWADPNHKFTKANSIQTIGIDFKQKSVLIKGKRVKVQVVKQYILSIYVDIILI